MVVIFMGCSRYYKCMYSNNVEIKLAPIDIPEGYFGWIQASLAIMSSPEAKEKLIDAIGLDCVMLLEYAELCLKLCVYLAVPLVLVLAPMHALLGGHRIAWSGDTLSMFSFGNVDNGSWLYWVHALVVWIVVFIVTHFARDGMQKFMGMRQRWLRQMPAPRSTTILVTRIPDVNDGGVNWQTDEKLKEYFMKLFPDKIKTASVAKQTDVLLALVAEQTETIRAMEQARSQKEVGSGKLVDGRDAVEQLNEKIEELNKKIEAERSAIKEAADKGEATCSAGFVTFNNRLDAQLALRFDFSCDGEQDEWVVSQPPDYSNISWKDLTQSRPKEKLFFVLGYVLTAGLYMAYLPIVVGISRICENVEFSGKLAFLDNSWKALAPTVGLHIMVSFLPTFLVMIFRGCFTMYDEMTSQHVLQNWYFVFQVVFIVLVTAISGSIFDFMKLCVENPFSVPQYLGETMPFATHFYMDYVMTQWVTHGMNLTRYIYIAKFLIYRRRYDDEEVARELSEPEDQDYYGIGARSARFSIMMTIGLVYGTICPPMIILCFINFGIMRLVYGYLMTFAEGRKGDMGGDCWVSQLNHLYISCYIYIIVMSGVLYGRASSGIPAIITFLALFFVIIRQIDFSESFSWKHLPYPQLKDVSDLKADKEADTDKYIQHELTVDLDWFRRSTSTIDWATHSEHSENVARMHHYIKQSSRFRLDRS
jgi:hypothetical protein